MEFLYKHPTSASWFASIQIEWLTRSLKGLFLMGFFGSLFFISLPTELVFVQYLDTSNHIIIIILVIVLANVLAMILNYILGFILGRTLLRLWLRDRFDSYQDTISYWGGIILLIGNILPSPIELVALVYGASKFPLTKYIYLVAIGRTIRYIILLYLFYSYPHIISFLIL
ncbi:MAG: VTT domain-containing protein [Nanoarchaeota archaeon]|nr:VTT domain-containing protein [Nanoarchaeota archaeon]